jgi:hypothetical protein
MRMLVSKAAGRLPLRAITGADQEGLTPPPPVGLILPL